MRLEQQPQQLEGPRAPTPTLSHKGLAGVKQDLAALNDHALDGQILTDILRLAHLIMHDPVGTGREWRGRMQLRRPHQR